MFPKTAKIMKQFQYICENIILFDGNIYTGPCWVQVNERNDPPTHWITFEYILC